MNREFSKREKILLLILAVLLIIIGYYKLVLQPINNQIESYENMAAEEQMQSDTMLVQALKMDLMQKEIDKQKVEGDKRIVPEFDNSSVLLPKLHHIMDSAVDYSLDFGELTNEEGFVTRPVQMRFETTGYEQARRIIDRLYAAGYAMQIEDMSLMDQNTTSRQSVVVNLSISFFEAVKQ